MTNKTRIGRRGIVLQSVIIAVLVFSFFVVSLWGMYVETAQQYNVSIDQNSNFSDAFDKQEEINELALRVANNTQSSQATITSSLVTFVSSGISSLQIVYSSVGIINSLGAAISNTLGVPAELFAFFITITIIVITFAIIAALLRTGGSF